MTRHMCIDVRGVLRWKDRDLKKLFTGGNATEIREHLMDKLADGWEVIPFGKECEGFDRKTGCPGHHYPGEYGGIANADGEII